MSRDTSRLEGLGAALAMLRARSGLSQQVIADAAGVKRTTVGAWENGKNDPSLGPLGDALAAMGFDFCDLEDALREARGEPPRRPATRDARPWDGAVDDAIADQLAEWEESGEGDEHLSDDHALQLLAYALRVLRIREDMTRREIEAASGIPADLVRRAESGAWDPPYTALARLLAYYRNEDLGEWGTLQEAIHLYPRAGRPPLDRELREALAEDAESSEEAAHADDA